MEEGTVIEASVQTCFTVYLFAWMIFLVALWLRELWRSNVYDWALSEGNLCICGKCHFAFLAKPGEKITRCPKCNEVSRVRKMQRWI